MKHTLFTLCCLFMLAAGYAQTQMDWGREITLKKGTDELYIVNADASGVFLEESHYVVHHGFWSSRQRKSSELIKMDASLSYSFQKDYDEELQGKEFETFFFIQDKVYLFATTQDNDAKILTLYGVEIDKNSGNFIGNWTEVYHWELAKRGTDVDFRIAPSSDSSRIVISSSNASKTQNRYEVAVFDPSLKPAGNAFAISNEFDPSDFQVEDYVYTAAGTSILVGRGSDSYSIRIYNNEGRQINEIATDADGKYLVNHKLIVFKNEVVLAAYYSSGKKRKEIDGMLVEKIDAATGKVLSVTKNEDKNGLSSDLLIRYIFETPDNGLVVLSEKCTHRKMEVTSLGYDSQHNMGPAWNGASIRNEYELYTCKDIFINKISAQGNIDWVKVLPKEQWETVLRRSEVAGQKVSGSWFNQAGNRPFLAGYGCMQDKNTLNILFNDSRKNADVVDAGKKVAKFDHFHFTDCYRIQLNLSTGQMTRTSLFSNKDILPAMPRLGFVVDNSMYMMGRDDQGINEGKAQIALGKLSF